MLLGHIMYIISHNGIKNAPFLEKLGRNFVARGECGHLWIPAQYTSVLGKDTEPDVTSDHHQWVYIIILIIQYNNTVTKC